MFGKIPTSGEFCNTNFELFAQNFEEMLEICRKYLRNFGLIM